MGLKSNIPNNQKANYLRYDELFRKITLTAAEQIEFDNLATSLNSYLINAGDFNAKLESSNLSGYVNGTMATATNDILIGNVGGGSWIKKTLAEFIAILGLKNAAYKDVGTTSGTVCTGDDSRLSNSRQCNNNFDSASISRTNLGLGDIVTKNSSDFISSSLVAGDYPFYTSTATGQHGWYTQYNIMLSAGRISVGGTVRVKFNFKSSVAGKTQSARIYKNGVAVGTVRQTSSSTDVTFSEDFAVSAGDLLEIWGQNYDNLSQGIVSNFWICSNSANPTMY